jgi:predicted component of type VI protein secretion system
MRALKVTSGPDAGRAWEVERELVIGREDADLTFDDPELSRRHAAVRPIGGGVEIADLGSRNGTFVDGERIESSVSLTASCTIRVGQTHIEVELRPEQPAVTAPDVTAPRQVPGGAQGDVAQPDLTALRKVPEAPDPEVASPDVTAPRRIPGRPGDAAPPDVTAPRQVPAPGAGDVASPDVTAPRRIPRKPPGDVASPDVTVKRPVQGATPDDAAEGGGRGIPPLAIAGAVLAIVLIVLVVLLAL